MKLLLKNADGESVCITVRKGDTFLDLKMRIAEENNIDLDIEEFNMRGCPVQNHLNVIEYLQGNTSQSSNHLSDAQQNTSAFKPFIRSHTTAEPSASRQLTMEELGSGVETVICRLCAVNCSDAVHLSTVIDKIASCLPIKVKLGDELSQSVCISCSLKLSSYQEFIESCVEAQKRQFESFEQESRHKKNECVICLKDEPGKSLLSTSEFFEALERHNAVCLQPEEKAPSDEGSEIMVFCSLCQQNVTLTSCLKGECHEANVYCCFLCDATLGNSNELREHLKEHLSEDGKSGKEAEGKDSEDSAKAASPKQVFRCPHCHKLFRCQSRLDFHLQFHTKGARAGQCLECRKDFPSESCLYKHMLYNHLDPKVFTCEQCGKMFRNKSSLTYHARSHTSLEAMRPYSCEVCKKRFARKNILRDHLTNRHGGVPSTQSSTAFQCRVCQEVFPTTNYAVSHMEVHHGDAADRSAGYSLDMLTVHKLFVCELCDKCYALPETLSKHRLQHSIPPRHQCKMCNEEFMSYVQLKTHLDGHASDGITDYKSEFRVPTLFVCEFCEKCFKNYQCFTSHCNAHLEDKLLEPYRCRFCPQVFDSYSAVIEHRDSHSRGVPSSRPANSLKPFECQFCDKSFTSGSALTKHIRVHTGERPYKCQVCSKSFAQSSGLYTHLKVHSSERPYQCDICERSFKIIGDYKQHVRKHSGQRPYPCPLCPKTFMTQQSFAQHKKIHTDSRPFVCEICQESFRRAHTLQIHLRKHKNK